MLVSKSFMNLNKKELEELESEYRLENKLSEKDVVSLGSLRQYQSNKYKSETQSSNSNLLLG